MTKENKTEKKKQGKLPLTLAAVVTALAVVYVGTAVYCQSHFNFGATIGGMKVGGKTASEVENLMKEQVKSYKILLKERGGDTEEILGTDIGVELKFEGEAEALIKNENAFAWIADLFRQPDYTLGNSVVVDETALKREVRGLNAMKPENQKSPVDASYSEYGSNGYELVPADYGKELEEQKVIAAVTEAITTLQETIDLDESGCYAEPKVKDDDEKLLAAIEKLNTYAATEIHYEFGSNDEVLNSEIITEWLSIDENREAVIDEEAVLTYVKGLAKRHNTAYSNKKLATSYGKEVTISGGAYGWRIDNAGERDQILKDLESGEKVEREAVFLTRANSYDGPDYGNSYVEINLTAQHLFLYVNGKLIVESDLVSGCVREGNETPGGAFPITYTTTNAVLRGRDYRTPVDYWMPFNGNIGMHDLKSRKSFGGDIYLTNGSHGCINLPYDSAKKIYEHVEAGFPVLVYSLPGTESPEVKAKAAAKEAANKVIKAINGIGPVTELSGPPIKTARELYDALDSSAKSKVTNYDVLVNSEAAFAAIQAQKTQQEQQAQQTQEVQQTQQTQETQQEQPVQETQPIQEAAPVQ